MVLNAVVFNMPLMTLPAGLRLWFYYVRLLFQPAQLILWAHQTSLVGVEGTQIGRQTSPAPKNEELVAHGELVWCNCTWDSIPREENMDAVICVVVRR
jgi:hypothetical protein